MGGICLFLWIVELLRNVWPWFFRQYNVIFGSMLRKSELNAQKKLTGTGFFFTGCFLCIYLFEPIVAICAILFLVLGDLAAALVGVSMGRTKLVGRKSLEGALAMFFTCFTISSMLFHHMLLWDYACLIGSLAATLVELMCPAEVDDNLAIPVLSGLALQFAIIRGTGNTDIPLP
jgi:dolichol kinase